MNDKSAELVRVADGLYQSEDGRFRLVYRPDQDVWLVFREGNTEPDCESQPAPQ